MAISNLQEIHRPNLVIVRGPAGSGKSTFAKQCFPKHFHHETDRYFMVGGKYKFDPARLATLHAINFAAVKADLEHGHDCVVSNTFTKMWELEPYLELHANIVVFRMLTDLQTCIDACVHGVPAHVIAKMYNRMDDVKGEYGISR